MRESTANNPQPDIEALQQIFSQNEAEWLALIRERDAMNEQFSVSVKNDEIEGVKVHHVIPADVDLRHEDHLFIYMHGGAYILFRGEASLPEAILIASRLRCRCYPSTTACRRSIHFRLGMIMP